MIDEQGAVVGDLYDEVGWLRDGVAPCIEDLGGLNSWGLINAKGKVVVPAQYDAATTCAEGLHGERVVTWPAGARASSI